MPLQSTSTKTTGKIVGTIVIGPETGEWYGTIVVNDIKYDDGSSVTIQKFLGIKFKSPKVSAETTVNAQLDPWQQFSASISTEDIDETTVGVTAKIIVTEAHTFKSHDTLTWQINGNLITPPGPEAYTESFEFFADELPSGTVMIKCAGAPHPELGQSIQAVNFKQAGQPTSYSLLPYETKSFPVVSGKYTVTADDLTNAAETIVAKTQVSPSQVTIETDQITNVEVTYDNATAYCALDVILGQFSTPLDTEQLRVTVVNQATSQTLAEFFSLHNYKTDLRRLPVFGTVVITAEVTVNNVKYYSIQTTELENKLVEITILQKDFKTETGDTSNFVDVPIVLDTEFTKPDLSISVRLRSTTSATVYTQNVIVDAENTKFDVKIAPGVYQVQARGFLDGRIVYAVLAPVTLTAATGAKLELQTKRGANLDVYGFPNYLSFGAISDLVDKDGKAHVAAHATSVFKYAGIDGAGDAGYYLADDAATRLTVELAHTIESQLGSGHKVLPIMISYTVNLSLGDTHTQLQNEDQLKHSFGNLILSLEIAKETAAKNGNESAVIGYVVNADFLGECQKGPNGTRLEPTYAMPVIAPLMEALQHRAVDGDFSHEFPSQINDTLKGYVFAVNWLFRRVAQNVTFGWQVNVWGVGNSTWIYSRDTESSSPAVMAKSTADYIKELAVYSEENPPDFLAIDRYEGDDFTLRAYANSYCYGPYEWSRFYDFCSAVSLELQVPVMPWQIPASRIPNRNESVVNLEVEQWGSGGTYLFGDALIGSDYRNIHPTVLGIKQTNLVPHADVEEIFKSAQPFNLSIPAYEDFLYRGIFTVLLGGGATTGIIEGVGKTGPWTQEKLKAYSANPIPI